jgi:hypothetical protein
LRRSATASTVYPNAFKAVFGEEFPQRVVLSSYELSEPAIESYIVNFKSANAEALLDAGTGRFAAPAIRRSNGTGWKPSPSSASLRARPRARIVPAGVNNSVGLATGTFSRDPNDPNVWSGRALQEDFVELGRRSCINVSGL